MSVHDDRRTVLRAGLGACAALLVGCDAQRAPRTSASELQAFSGQAMGTTYHVRFAAARPDAGLLEAARRAAAAALEGVEQRMSAFRRDSELSRLNRQAGEEPFAVSADTLEVFSTARMVSDASGGAFDVTAGGLVNAWGFGPDKLHRVVPAPEVAMLRERMGYRGLHIDAGERRITKTHPGLMSDLSGIAKGHGVDRAAQALEALGIGDYVIEAGGEVRARGNRHDGRPWQVGVEQPNAWPQEARWVVPLRDLSMATSGDYRIFFERNGRRYCHEMDPSTGRPIAHRLTSVTVVAPLCAVADAFATALIVLGPDRGPALAERLGLAAYFITREADGALRDRQTSAFSALGGRSALV
ncbi:MAG TPA: FAD:protein FMN transferase [Albitalea sp.]|nr:FAD:protein FMN transferase [Albitalea sp.]